MYIDGCIKYINTYIYIALIEMYILVVSLAIPNELMSYECFAE